MEEWSGIITIIRYLHSLPSTSKKHGDFSQHVCYRVKTWCMYVSIWFTGHPGNTEIPRTNRMPIHLKTMAIPQGLGICWSFWPWHIWEESSTCNKGKPNLNPTFHVEIFTSTSCWFMRLHRLYMGMDQYLLIHGGLDYRGSVGPPHGVDTIEKTQPCYYKMQCQPAARSLQHAVLGQKWSSTKCTSEIMYVKRKYYFSKLWMTCIM